MHGRERSSACWWWRLISPWRVAGAMNSTFALWTAALAGGRHDADLARHAALRRGHDRGVAAAAVAGRDLDAVRYDLPLQPALAQRAALASGAVRWSRRAAGVYAGRRLGVVDLHPDLWPSLLSLAVLWSLALPASMWLSERQAPRDGAGEYRWPAGPAPRATTSAAPVGASGRST